MNIYIENNKLKEVNRFTYLGCNNEDILNRLKTARMSFASLNNWGENISTTTKIRILNTNVLLYREKIWHCNRTNIKTYNFFC